jgi:hypothetical protein
MRAPDETINITAARWESIKDVCRRVGVDADQVMVKVNKNETPLRAELERLAVKYIKDKNSKTPTERQCNAVIEEGLDKIAAFRDQYMLKRNADGHDYRDMVAFFVSHDVIKKVLQTLDDLETELRASLVANPIRESNAAERARDHYWFMLYRLWKKIAPHAGKRKNSVADFLQVVTGASPSAIKNFLDRLPRKARIIAHYYNL